MSRCICLPRDIEEDVLIGKLDFPEKPEAALGITKQFTFSRYLESIFPSSRAHENCLELHETKKFGKVDFLGIDVKHTPIRKNMSIERAIELFNVQAPNHAGSEIITQLLTLNDVTYFAGWIYTIEAPTLGELTLGNSGKYWKIPITKSRLPEDFLKEMKTKYGVKR